LARGTQKVTKFWDFDPAKSTRYRTDAEYEEHFRDVFAQAVGRRLRSDSPVLAELSGGMDSSSIVCMADEIARHEPGGARRVETVSYYDDSEPNWN
jgi:asparagine synthase (glutamine-hydrolysing)